MFCPEGYVSVAELWVQYRKKRLKDFYLNAAEHYRSDDFHSVFARGSPLDICEHIFLKSLAMIGLCLVSPRGDVMKVHAPLNDGRASLCSVLPANSSTWRWAAHQLEADKTIDGQTLEVRSFLPWGENVDDDKAWSQAYPVPDADRPANWTTILEDLRFHCLPVCFDRPSYCVLKELPPWSLEIRNKGDIEALVENFGGWSMCLADEAVAQWKPYLEGQGV